MQATEKTYRLSSNLTFPLKIGFPLFWGIFFGAMTLGLLLVDGENIAITGIAGFKWGIVAFFLLFLLIILFTVVRIKRVEIGNGHLYASNYFKTFRYPFADVQKIKSLDFILFLVLIVHLKNKGNFGNKIPFIASRTRLKNYLEDKESDQLISAIETQMGK